MCRSHALKSAVVVEHEGTYVPTGQPALGVTGQVCNQRAATALAYIKSKHIT